MKSRTPNQNRRRRMLANRRGKNRLRGLEETSAMPLRTIYVQALKKAGFGVGKPARFSDFLSKDAPVSGASSMNEYSKNWSKEAKELDALYGFGAKWYIGYGRVSLVMAVGLNQFGTKGGETKIYGLAPTLLGTYNGSGSPLFPGILRAIYTQQLKTLDKGKLFAMAKKANNELLKIMSTQSVPHVTLPNGKTLGDIYGYDNAKAERKFVQDLTPMLAPIDWQEQVQNKSRQDNKYNSTYRDPIYIYQYTGDVTKKSLARLIKQAYKEELDQTRDLHAQALREKEETAEKFQALKEATEDLWRKHKNAVSRVETLKPGEFHPALRHYTSHKTQEFEDALSNLVNKYFDKAQPELDRLEAEHQESYRMEQEMEKTMRIADGLEYDLNASLNFMKKEGIHVLKRLKSRQDKSNLPDYHPRNQDTRRHPVLRRHGGSGIIMYVLRWDRDAPIAYRPSQRFDMETLTWVNVTSGKLKKMSLNGAPKIPSYKKMNQVWDEYEKHHNKIVPLGKLEPSDLTKALQGQVPYDSLDRMMKP